MTDQSEWTGKVGNVWAEEWQRTDRSFGPLTQKLLAAARSAPFAQAIDIGCGAGEISSTLAAGAPSSHVLGVDISHDLLQVARVRGKDRPNLRFELANAANWYAGAAERPDLVVSRHGVMFFADPTAAFTHIAGQAAPGARLAFSCFRERADNIWARELASIAPPGEEPAPDPEAPGPFALGRRERTETLLAQAGWTDIAFEAVDYGMVAGEGAEAVADALSYFQRIGPVARAAAALEAAPRATMLAKLEALLEAHHRDGQVSLPAACWIVTARAPG